MANIKSQKKRNITNAKRNERNKAVKAELKTRQKVAVDSIGTDANAEDASLSLRMRLSRKDFLIQSLHSSKHVERRGNRMPCMLRIGNRCIPERHHGIAHIFVHGTAMFQNRLRQDRQETIEDPHEFFRSIRHPL